MIFFFYNVMILFDKQFDFCSYDKIGYIQIYVYSIIYFYFIYVSCVFSQ